MKNIFFLIFLGPFFFSQNFQIKDSLKILAVSKFKTMDIYKNKNGKLIPVRNYSYDQNKNEITIKNTSDTNEEWVKTIIRLDNDYNIKEEEKVIEGMMISEKENKLVNKRISMITKYSYIYNTVHIKEYDDSGRLFIKQFNLFDDQNRIVESIRIFNSYDDIVISKIEKYNWIGNDSYNYEKLTFNAPRSQVTGVYKLNQYGERQSFKGSIIINDKTDFFDFSFEKKIRQFDSKGNIVKISVIEDDGKENILEERKIVY